MQSFLKSYNNNVENEKKIIIFGGDVFCGWPTSLCLSSQGYEVVMVDNLSRRKSVVELEIG